MIFEFALIMAGPVTESTVTAQAPKPQLMRKARDPDFAVQEELNAARATRTLGAYDLFIARHPRHPLAKIARRERAVLARGAGRAL